MKKTPARPLNSVLLRLLALRLLLPMWLLTLLVTGLPAYLGKQHIETRQRSQAHALARITEDYLEHASRMLDALAGLAETGAPEEMDAAMQSAWENYGYFDTLYQLDKKGVVTLVAPADLRYQGLDMSRQPYFRPTGAGSGVTVSLPFISPHTGQPTVYITRPLAGGGLLVGELSLGALQEAVTAGHDEQDEYSVFVADGSGALLAHPRPELVAQQENVGHLEIVRRGLAGEATQLYTIDGAWVLGVAAPLERVGWVVVAQAPVAAIYGPYIKGTGLFFLLMLALGLILVAYLGRQLQGQIAAPLAWLAREAEALAAGDFAGSRALAAAPSAFAEVGALEADFQRMSQAVQAREEALRESEERYRQLVENANDFIYRTDASGHLTFANPATLRVTGYSEEELIGRHYLELIRPDSRQDAERFYGRQYAKKTQNTYYEFPAIASDGTEKWFGQNVQLLMEGDRFVGFQAMARDITQRRRAEEMLKRRDQALAMLYETSMSLSSNLPLDAVLQSVAGQLTRALGSSRCVLSLYRHEENQLETLVDHSAAWPDRTEPPGTMYNLDDYAATRRVLESGRPLVVQHDDPTADEAELAWMRGEGVCTLLMLPLVTRDRTLGLVELIDEVRRRDYAPEEIRLAESLAAQAAVAIENARLYEAEKELHRQARRDAETRAVLLREVNHRVKNNLTAILGLLSIERRRTAREQSPAYQALVNDLTNRINSLAQVHSLLSAAEWQPLLLSDLARQIIHTALQSLPGSESISVSVTPSSVQVTPDQAHNLAMVINELTTNTLKHAVQGRGRAQITVRITPDDEVIQCEFRDDGPGYAPEVLRLECQNVGMSLIHNLVRKGLRGELELRNDQGAVTIIRFKMIE